MTDPKGAAWPICEANQICAIVASSSGRGPGKELVAQQRMLQHCDQSAAWGSGSSAVAAPFVPKAKAVLAEVQHGLVR